MEKKNEHFLLAAVFLFWFSVYTYPSFLTTYATNTLGATKTLAGMIVGSYGLTQMILRIPLGIASDALKKRKLFVMIGFMLSIIASAGLSVTALIAGREKIPEGLAYAVLVFRGMSGMMAATWVNFSVLYASSYRDDEAAVAMSRIVVPQCGSQILAMLSGALIAGAVGELWAFLLAAAAGAAGLIVMSRVKEQPPTGEPLTVKGFLEVLRNRQLICGTVLAMIYMLVVWTTVQGFVQNWARDIIGMTTAQLGFLSVANLLPNTVLSRFSGTVFAPKFGRKAVLAAGFAAIAAACLLYPKTRSMGSLLAVQALLGSGVGLIMPLTMASAIETVPNARRGAAMGIYQALYGVGMFLGPVIGGVIIDRFGGSAEGAAITAGYTANFYTAMGIAIFGGILAVVITGKSISRTERK
ncbi:MAG: MFS transporter [Lachnospiraceae bacterium]|nr:MFS transporter [Lachnospiraceae bacterium]